MAPPFPSAAPTWRNDTYPAISPSRPELNSAGKVIVITGAGSGIGRETALAFASAGAAKIVLLGRKESTLVETRDALPESCEGLIHTVSVTDSHTLKKIASEVGPWDVLILNAGFLSSPAKIVDADTDDWWQSYETNVKGVVITVKAFLPTANQTKAAVFGVGAGTVTLPSAMLTGLSSYISSKLAQAKVLEFLAAENPTVFVASVHPGMIVTDIFNKSGAPASKLPMDTLKLPAHFMVWLASPEASFLSGKLVWANWDVEELKTQAENISSDLSYMTTGTIGWPYPHSG